MIKTIGAIAALSLSMTTAFAAKSDVLGVWLTDKGDSRVEVYQCGENVCGKIIWLKTPTYPAGHAMAGQPLVDRKNENESQRDRAILGLQIMSKYEWEEDDNEWEDGEIYSPRKGESFESKIWVEDGVMKVRGYSGIFHETKDWTRVK